MYTVDKDANPNALKPWLVVNGTTVVARFVLRKYAAKKARQLNYRRGAR